MATFDRILSVLFTRILVIESEISLAGLKSLEHFVGSRTVVQPFWQGFTTRLWTIKNRGCCLSWPTPRKFCGTETGVCVANVNSPVPKTWVFPRFR
jgi:hypothetical protein